MIAVVQDLPETSLAMPFVHCLGVLTEYNSYALVYAADALSGVKRVGQGSRRSCLQGGSLRRFHTVVLGLLGDGKRGINSLNTPNNPSSSAGKESTLRYRPKTRHQPLGQSNGTEPRQGESHQHNDKAQKASAAMIFLP